MLSLFFFLQIDVQQVMVYCDPTLAIQEACCEIPGARVILSKTPENALIHGITPNIKVILCSELISISCRPLWAVKWLCILLYTRQQGA